MNETLPSSPPIVIGAAMPRRPRSLPHWPETGVRSTSLLSDRRWSFTTPTTPRSWSAILRIEAVLRRLREAAASSAGRLPPARSSRQNAANAPAFDARAALHAVLGVDLTQIHGLGPSLALKLIGECGTDLSAWPNAKHFTSLATPGYARPTRSRRAKSFRRERGDPVARASCALLRLAAVTVGRTQTALGYFLSTALRTRRQGQGGDCNGT